MQMKLLEAPLEAEPWKPEQLYNIIKKLLEKPLRALPDTVIKAVIGAKADFLLMSMLSARILAYRPYSGL